MIQPRKSVLFSHCKKGNLKMFMRQILVSTSGSKRLSYNVSDVALTGNILLVLPCIPHCSATAHYTIVKVLFDGRSHSVSLSSWP